MVRPEMCGQSASSPGVRKDCTGHPPRATGLSRRERADQGSGGHWLVQALADLPGGLGSALDFLGFSFSLCKWESGDLPYLHYGVILRIKWGCCWGPASLPMLLDAVQWTTGCKWARTPTLALRAFEPGDAVHFSGLALSVEIMNSGSW